MGGGERGQESISCVTNFRGDIGREDADKQR